MINGKAAANIMGDWAGGEFQVAKMIAGKDYDCLPGLGVTPVLNTGGDVFYFPKVKDPAAHRLPSSRWLRRWSTQKCRLPST